MGYSDFIFSMINIRDLFLILIGAIASIVTTYFVRTREKGLFFEKIFGKTMGEDIDYGVHVFLASIVALALIWLIGFGLYLLFSFMNHLPDVWIGLPDLIKLLIIIFGLKWVLGKVL